MQTACIVVLKQITFVSEADVHSSFKVGFLSTNSDLFLPKVHLEISWSSYIF